MIVFDAETVLAVYKSGCGSDGIAKTIATTSYAMTLVTSFEIVRGVRDYTGDWKLAAEYDAFLQAKAADVIPLDGGWRAEIDDVARGLVDENDLCSIELEHLFVAAVARGRSASVLSQNPIYDSCGVPRHQASSNGPAPAFGAT